MPRKTTRNAQGSGTIRQRPDGRWEGRYTEGKDTGTGKPIRRSIYGDTEQDVRKRLTAITYAIDSGTYLPPQKMTVSEWLDIWLNEYAENSVKKNTALAYRTSMDKHVIPALGAVQLQALTAYNIQTLYNSMQKGTKDTKALSPKTIRNCHGIFHRALKQAVKLGYIHANPADACDLPRLEKTHIQPLNEGDIKRFIKALENEPYKNLFTVALFTGTRQAELLGLQWNCVDFDAGTITIDKQLMKVKKKNGPYILASTKTDNIRVITPAPTVMQALKAERSRQAENKLKAYGAFQNPDNLVFTDELGKHLVARTVVKHYKRIVEALGIPERRYHDLRHSYATMALKSGDNIKEVQTNLGHSTVAITLDLYSHVTQEMKKASADRMERFITSLKQA
jgi:integrase